MEKRKEIRLRLSERNWARAKKNADEAGTTVSAWVAVKVIEKLDEQEALRKLSGETRGAFAEEFPGAYLKLLSKLKSGKIKESHFAQFVARLREASGEYLNSERLEQASKNMLRRIKSIEPALDRLKKSSAKNSVSSALSETSGKLHEELQSLAPAIEKLKKASRDCIGPETAGQASKRFAEQMRSIESALKKLLEKNEKNPRL